MRYEADMIKFFWFFWEVDCPSYLLDRFTLLIQFILLYRIRLEYHQKRPVRWGSWVREACWRCPLYSSRCWWSGYCLFTDVKAGWDFSAQLIPKSSLFRWNLRIWMIDLGIYLTAPNHHPSAWITPNILILDGLESRQVGKVRKIVERLKRALVDG